VQDPEEGQIRYPTAEVGVPAKNRFNLGLNWNSKRFLGNLSMNYSDEAFWNDVLDAPYHGTTDSYAMVNGTFGVKWGAEGKVQTTLKAINLFNEQIQQHIYGDILRMSLVAEVRILVK
jgi:hypothetical protein